MLKTLIQYQMYIIIGILVFPIFAFIIYFAKNLIDRSRFVKTLHKMKKPLMERINSVEAIYELKEQTEEMNMIINDIKNNITNLKQEIHISQHVLPLEQIDQIEQEITNFYEKMQSPQPPQEPVIIQPTAQQIYQEAIAQKQAYEEQVNQQQTALQKQQVQVMNQNISKFLVVYREKDKLIDEKNKSIAEKNKSIYILQQKLNEAEQRLKQYAIEQRDERNKDGIIEEKTRLIQTLQQRLQEVENKFSKIALLHKSITEKEQIKDTIIQEKNEFIANLQYKLNEIEGKLQSAIAMNEDNKDRFFNKKLIDIDEKIAAEKRKSWTFIILFLLFLLFGI